MLALIAARARGPRLPLILAACGSATTPDDQPTERQRAARHAAGSHRHRAGPRRPISTSPCSHRGHRVRPRRGTAAVRGLRFRRSKHDDGATRPDARQQPAGAPLDGHPGARRDRSSSWRPRPARSRPRRTSRRSGGDDRRDRLPMAVDVRRTRTTKGTWLTAELHRCRDEGPGAGPAGQRAGAHSDLQAPRTSSTRSTCRSSSTRRTSSPAASTSSR